MILETPRLILREMRSDDLGALKEILQDKAVMYAYEHAFSNQEVLDWLANQQRRYREDGFGLWAAVLKENGRMIGQCGLTLQQWNNRQVPEIGYLFQKSYWHQGYATEAALACRTYAFDTLDLSEVFSIIRDNNYPSQAVARRLSMQLRGELTKHYHNKVMPHIVFSVRKDEAQAAEPMLSGSADTRL